VLTGIFLTHALLGELVGGKLFRLGPWLLSVGVLPWPVVFVTTDLVNEYYGPRAVRRLTLLAIALIVYAFGVLWLCMLPAAATESAVDDASFLRVFGQSQWIIVGSVVAFAVSQWVDAVVFVRLRAWLGGRHVEVRAVLSTIVSQVVDTLTVNAVAFGLSGKLGWTEVLTVSAGNYVWKFLVALGTAPVIGVAHRFVGPWIAGDARAEQGSA
jgi:hypothetical protein